MALWQDVRFAFRQLRKSPTFTLVVLATLGLCIGVNTAIFSVLDAVLLRPAPYPQVDRLAMVATVYGRGDTSTSQTGTLFESVRDGASSLDTAAYSGVSEVNFVAPGHLESIHQQRVSAGFFRVLGVAPQYGREFLPAEDKRGGPAIAVLNYDFWRRIFNGDASVLGRGIALRGEPYTVIGIMPRGFRTEAPADVWTPLYPSRTGEGSGTNYGVVARLKPGVSWERANQELKALSQNIVDPNIPRKAVWTERIIPLQTGLTGEVRSELLITWGAVLAVLLIGCVNIAGLLLARSSTRSREIATRMALGGGRAAIVRQLLVESLLLALGGCVAGIGIGTAAIGWLKRLGAEHFELWHPIEIDGRVLVAMVAMAVLTSLVFGLMPAVSTSRLDIRSVLVEGGRAVAGGRRRWSRQALVACEVALSLVLLVSAGLLLRTLEYLNGLSPGFDTRNVISAQGSLQDARYKTSAAVNRLYRESLERIGQIPGVQGAAVALTLPFERPLNDGFELPESGDTNFHGMETIYATAGYLEMMRIPLYRGRTLRDSDTADTAKVVVVSQTFAAKYFRGKEAVGHHLRIEGSTWEIVGVVGDVQQHSGLADLGPLAVEPTVYMPPTQLPDGYFQMIHTWFPPKWVVRASGPAGTLAAQIQAAVAGVDPQLPITKFQTVDDLQSRITSGQRYDAALFSILAGLGLLLAAIGLSGLISQSVAQRTHDLGIRMALGATAGQAIGKVIKPGILLAVAGVAAGYVLSRVAVRFLEHLLYGVPATDAVTFVATAGLLLLVAMAASLVPALQILRLDPAQTLRNE
ncbi:MAG TPA: ABC transporter permease [Bryobacteraceae bacterium]|nr:ABC transporter permease [Bryobacteraceae bacterium]